MLKKISFTTSGRIDHPDLFPFRAGYGTIDTISRRTDASGLLGKKGSEMVEKVIIMGAAGRDFHNFNIYFKNNPRYDVVAFTAAQIPDIENRCYPPELAGGQYLYGIPLFPEDRLAGLIR